MITLLGITAGVGWWGVSSLSDLAATTVGVESTLAESEHPAHFFYAQRVQKIQKTLIFVICITAFLSLIIPAVLIRNIIGPIKNLTKAARQLAEGDVNQSITIQGSDEQTQLGMAFRNIIDKTSEMASHAQAVAAGDFSQSIVPRGPNDVLATSLNQMTESLARTREQNQNRSWVDSGRNLLSTRIEGKEHLEELAEGITSALAEHLEAHAGLLYLPYDRNSFLVEGSYGVSETVSMTISCELGEGFLGQAIQDRKVKIIENADDSDLKISSGLGAVSSRCVVAFPLIYNEEVAGALEFALSRPFLPRDLDFLELVSDSISVTLARVLSGEKSRELLKVTSNQAKALDRHRQELARKADELAAASDHKSRFLANMSHDLRSPMNSIMILSGLMKESDMPREDIIENSEIIQSCGAELLQLIDDILDLSKVEAGQLEFHEDIVPLADLCRTIEKILSPQARQKGLEFHVVNSGADRKTVKTDLKRILQIIRNLVSNAIKFTSKGSVSINVGPDTDRPQFLAISVSDTGMGIAPHRQEIIFEEFRQAEKGTDRVYGGTGLGLSICLKLAQGLEGSLSLQSTPGEGSTFKLLIPWSLSTEKFAEVEDLIMESKTLDLTTQEEQEKPVPNGCRALVVGPDMRRLFSVVSDMEQCGCSVAAVSNFEQAAQVFTADQDLNLLMVDCPDGVVDVSSFLPLVDSINERNIPVVVRGPSTRENILGHIFDVTMVDFLGEERPMEDALQFRNSSQEII